MDEIEEYIKVIYRSDINVGTMIMLCVAVVQVF